MSDIQKLFEGQELSEAFVQKATTLIEAEIELKKQELDEAHQAKVVEMEQLAEQHKEEIQAELEGLSESYIQQELVPQVSKYLTAAVNEWLEENKIAIETGSKVELAESFLKGMVGLVESHDFDLDIEKADRLAEMEQKLDEVKAKLNEAIDDKIELSNLVTEMTKYNLIAEQVVDLAESQSEKIFKAAKSVEFKSEEQYSQAIKTLKESYFPDAKEIEQIVESQGQTKEIITESNSYLDSFVKRL